MVGGQNVALCVASVAIGRYATQPCVQGRGSTVCDFCVTYGRTLLSPTVQRRRSCGNPMPDMPAMKNTVCACHVHKRGRALDERKASRSLSLRDNFKIRIYTGASIVLRNELGGRTWLKSGNPE